MRGPGFIIGHEVGTAAKAAGRIKYARGLIRLLYPVPRCAYPSFPLHVVDASSMPTN